MFWTREARFALCRSGFKLYVCSSDVQVSDRMVREGHFLPSSGILASFLDKSGRATLALCIMSTNDAITEDSIETFYDPTLLS